MIQLLTDDLIRYENNELTDEEEVVFFQKLIDTGMAWTLQGHYGRNAERLIDEGLCTVPDEKEGQGHLPVVD